MVALPLTMDTRARYGRALGKMIGDTFTEWLFSVVTTASLVTLRVISTTELSVGVIRALEPSMRWGVTLGVLILVVWTWGSFLMIKPLDVLFTTGSFSEMLGEFATGSFIGLFVAAPSFFAMLAASHSPGMSIPNYIKCQSISWWERAIAVLP